MESFLYGEQIGQTLISQASTTPLLICTDREPALAAREHVSTPLVLVLAADEAADGEPKLGEHEAGENRAASFGSTRPITAAHDWRPSNLAETAWPCPSGPTNDRRLIAERLADLAESFDLAEPFQRIRDAIEEAQQAVR